MQTLKQDIKERTFKRMYLLYGEEAFLKTSYKNRLTEAVTSGDTMNFARFEGKGLDLDEIIRLADTMPLFSEKRLILVEDSGFFKGSAEELVRYLPSMPDTTVLLFVESEVDKRGKLYKTVKQFGYAAELGRQDAAQLGRWAGKILAGEGKKITNRTMEYFLGMTGDDMEHIYMELEKLISYTMGREVITNDDVRAICTVQVTNKIFEMVSAIADRRIKRAMELYEDLLIGKEPPMRILFLIARQFNQMLQVKELMAKGLDRGAIASRLGLKPFVVGKVMPQTHRFSHEQILSYIKLCVDSEEAVKSGRLADQLAVELLITGDIR